MRKSRFSEEQITQILGEYRAGITLGHSQIVGIYDTEKKARMVALKKSPTHNQNL